MYHAEAGFDRLKCDVTVLLNSQDNTSAILLMNFNLPNTTVVDNANRELPQRLEEIVAFLNVNLPQQQLHYQIAASYWLQHKHSGDRKRWVGSFFARDLAAASISGPIFLRFNSNNFVNNAQTMLNINAIRLALTANFQDSSWHFSELISAIVNFQCVLPIDHPFLLRHGLLTQRRRRRNRRHVTLFPFAIAEAPVP